jgi:hypothetical protein
VTCKGLRAGFVGRWAPVHSSKGDAFGRPLAPAEGEIYRIGERSANGSARLTRRTDLTMERLSRKSLAAIVATCALAAIVPAVVVASVITGATAIAVNVTGKLKSNTVSVLNATVAGVHVTLTCTGLSTAFQMTTKGGHLGPFKLSNPAFTGCTDSLGGTDSVKTNSTNGAWTATYVSSASATSPDKISVGIPKAGETITSTAAAGCTLTLAPSAPASLAGPYDNAGNLSYASQPVPFAASSGCPGGAATGTASFSTALKSGGTGTAGIVLSPPILGIK